MPTAITARTLRTGPAFVGISRAVQQIHGMDSQIRWTQKISWSEVALFMDIMDFLLRSIVLGFCKSAEHWKQKVITSDSDGISEVSNNLKDISECGIVSIVLAAVMEFLPSVHRQRASAFIRIGKQARLPSSSRVALANYVSAKYSLHREMLSKMYRRQALQQRLDKRNVRSVQPYRDIGSLYTARAFAYIDASVSILDIAQNIVVSPRSSWKPLGTRTQ